MSAEIPDSIEDELFGPRSAGLRSYIRGDHLGSIMAYSGEILEEVGIEPPDGFTLATHEDRSDKITRIAELALPDSRFGDLQRLTLSELQWPKENRDPLIGYHIGVRFPMGRAGALIAKPGGHYIFNADVRGHARIAYGKDPGTAKEFSRFLWRAAQKGTVVSPEDYGKWTFRERRQAVWAFLGAAPLGSSVPSLDSMLPSTDSMLP